MFLLRIAKTDTIYKDNKTPQRFLHVAGKMTQTNNPFDSIIYDFSDSAESNKWNGIYNWSP